MAINNLLPFILITGLASSFAQANSNDGKALHDKYCMTCHDSVVYTRKDRHINSLANLNKQVSRCELSQGLNWPDKDVTNVTNYLNESYYHFNE